MKLTVYDLGFAKQMHIDLSDEIPAGQLESAEAKAIALGLRLEDACMDRDRYRQLWIRWMGITLAVIAGVTIAGVVRWAL